jgi:hypothetical protein
MLLKVSDSSNNYNDVIAYILCKAISKMYANYMENKKSRLITKPSHGVFVLVNNSIQARANKKDSL